MKYFLSIAPILLLMACSREQTFPVTGTIVEIKTDQNEFIIHHDEIPGFMMAMTMPFFVSDSMDLYRFHVGDSLRFYLHIKEDKTIANKFELLGRGTLSEKKNFINDEYSPIDIGDILQDIKFLDLDSNEVSLSNSDGKFRLISYIFTRCPMPNMCPAVIVKNQYLAKEFSNDVNIEFLLISFDYIYDTPSTLKIAYANLLESNSNIKIYSSVGHINEIYTITAQSAVSFWGIDENDIGHNLRSILIDPERRLMQTYDGIDWRPEAVEKNIKNILKTYNL